MLQADILTFAGLALLLLAGLKALRLSDAAILALGFAINIGTSALYGVMTPPRGYLASQLLGFFVITDAESYFPLGCYFVFVAFGNWLGGVYPRIADKKRLSGLVLAAGLPACAAWYALRIAGLIPGLPRFNSLLQYVMMPGPDAAALCLTTLVSLSALYRLSMRLGGVPAPVDHLSRHINQYYCVSYMLVLPMQTVLLATQGALMPGWIAPVLYGLFAVGACALIIEWNERRLHFGVVKLQGPARTWAFAAIWALTIAVVAYAYPRIGAFANLWNNYLL